MNRDLADTVAQTTRDQAVHDARGDLWELRRRAVEAGRDRSRRIAKTSRIDPRSGELRYNPAGRLLRDWYVHVYLNTVRRDLGEPAVTIDAQQVEDTTALLKRLRHADGLAALQVVAMVRDTAIDDAAHAAAEIVDHLAGVAARRAILHAPADRFGGDELTVHVIRHWYLHCYSDHVHGATRSRHPLADVTDAQQREVAVTLTTGQARRLIGADGIPLVTAQGTRLSSTDRALAGGLAGLVSPITDHQTTAAGQRLSTQVTRTWAQLDHGERGLWLRAVDARRVSADSGWSQIPGGVQSKIIRLYLSTHQPHQVSVPFRGDVIDASPAEAAMQMFHHHQLLEGRHVDPDPTIRTQGRHDGADLLAAPQDRSAGVRLST